MSEPEVTVDGRKGTKMIGFVAFDELDITIPKFKDLTSSKVDLAPIEVLTLGGGFTPDEEIIKEEAYTGFIASGSGDLGEGTMVDVPSARGDEVPVEANEGGLDIEDTLLILGLTDGFNDLLSNTGHDHGSVPQVRVVRVSGRGETEKVLEELAVPRDTRDG